MSWGVWCEDCQTSHRYGKEWHEGRERSYDDPRWSPEDDPEDDPERVVHEGARKVG